MDSGDKEVLQPPADSISKSKEKRAVKRPAPPESEPLEKILKLLKDKEQEKEKEDKEKEALDQILKRIEQLEDRPTSSKKQEEEQLTNWPLEQGSPKSSYYQQGTDYASQRGKTGFIKKTIRELIIDINKSARRAISKLDRL